MDHHHFLRPVAPITVLLLVGFSSFLFVSPAIKAAHANTSWNSTTSIGTAGVYACVTAVGYIFCVGGGSTSGTHTYYATEGSTGIGTWTAGNAYPVSLTFPPACATDASFIYCIGGKTTAAPVYSASISSLGFGTWTVQNSYPINIELNSCVIYSGDIYCVAGFTGSATTATYYATASSGTIGTWTSTTAYPDAAYEDACVAITNTIICAGGFMSSPSYDAFKATLSGTGIGTWSGRSTMPIKMQLGSCVVVSSSDYCMGGNSLSSGTTAINNETMFTSVSNFPNWQTDVTSFSAGLTPDVNGCASDGSTIFCVGGWTNQALSTVTATTKYTSVISPQTTLKWTSQTAITGGGLGQTGGANGISQSCGWDNSFLFCVQANGTTRYASAASGTVGAWSKGTAYPKSFAVWDPICVTNSGFIYCIGGGDSVSVTNAVYSSPVSSSGFGTWTAQGNYPSNILGTSCIVSSNYVYCIGGSSTFSGSYKANTYAASLTSGTVGAWNSGTSYPSNIFSPGCAVLSSKVYCVDGYTGAPSRKVYSATLSTSSPFIGSWTQLTSYPTALWDFSCVSNKSRIYCIGGLNVVPNVAFQISLVYSTIDGTSWFRETNLPYSMLSLSGNSVCVMDSTINLYCIGGNLWNSDSTGADFIYTNQVFSTNTGLPRIIQSTSCTFTGSSGTCAFTSNTQAQSSIVVFTGATATTTVSSVTDTQLLTYLLIVASDVGTVGDDEAWWACHPSTAAADTVTVTYGVSVTATIILYELHGRPTGTSCAPSSSTGSSASASSASVTSYTPTASALIIGALDSSCQVACTITAGSTYLLDKNVAVNAVNMFTTEYNWNFATAETTPFTFSVASAYNEISVAFYDLTWKNETFARTMTLSPAFAPQLTLSKAFGLSATFVPSFNQALNLHSFLPAFTLSPAFDFFSGLTPPPIQTRDQFPSFVGLSAFAMLMMLFVFIIRRRRR